MELIVTKLLSKKEACHKLSISHATLARWEADPNLGFPKRTAIGNGTWKKVFYREDAIEEWIDRHVPR